MTIELQRANDMLAAMQAQRDNALNAMVHAQAELAERGRQISALTEDLRVRTEELEALKALNAAAQVAENA